MTREGWYCVEMKEEEERINEIEEELPQAFKLFIRLAEIAKERSNEEMVKRNRKGRRQGDNGSVDKLSRATSTPTLAVKHLIQGGIHNE